MRKCREFVAIAPGISGALAGVALCGWVLDFELLKSLGPGLTPMNPLTALCFLLLSAALIWDRMSSPNSARTGPAVVTAIVAFLGLWREVQYHFPLGLEFDGILFRQELDRQAIPNRMAETTAVAFLLLASGMLLLRGKSHRILLAGQAMVALAIGMGLMTVVAYAYEISDVTRPSAYVPMALNTGILFMVLGVAAIAARPNAGVMVEFVSQHFPGVVARRLVIGAVAVPVVIGWLRLVGERAGLYGQETGVALMAVFTTGAITALVWWAAQSLERVDCKRRAAESQIKELSEQLAQYNAVLEERVAERTQSLEQSQKEILERLSRASAYKDDETGRHTERMSAYSYLLAKSLQLPEAHCVLIRAASQLHDLGKIAVPDAILRKPGPLTTDEFDVIKTHPSVGADLLSGGKTDVVQMAERVALTHHERWDGAGYPVGLAGHAIPLEGRIVSVADVFDALTNARPYKRAWSLDEAFDEIRGESGKKFDPQVVHALLSIRSEIAAIAEDLRDR